VPRPQHPLVRQAPPAESRPQVDQNEANKFRTWQQSRPQPRPQPQERPPQERQAQPQRQQQQQRQNAPRPPEKGQDRQDNKKPQ
jgi:hypothetical protein